MQSGPADSSANFRAYVYMHLSVLLWGFTAILGKAINLSEGLLVWYRMLLVIASLFIYVKWRRISLSVSSTHILKLAGIGCILMIHWLFFYGAIKYSNVSLTLSLFSSTTLFTALIEPLVSKKRFNRIELLFSFVAFIGIVIVFQADGHNYPLGVFLALMAAFTGAFFNVLNKPLVESLSSSVISFYEILFGWLGLSLLLPIYIFTLHPLKILPELNDLILLLTLSIFCTHLPLLLSLTALKRLSAFTLNLTINLEPIYGIVLAFMFFQENKMVTTGFFVGTGIILLTVAVHAFISRQKPLVPV